MAKITRKNLDSIRRAPIRQSSYEAPALIKKKREVPQEYRTLKRAKHKNHGFLWVLFLIFLATFAGFVYWNSRPDEAVANSLEFAVQGPSEIVSGDQATYVIIYKNLDVVPLQQMELSVRWPAGFYFDEATSEPSDVNATTWLLNDLGINEQVELKITGQLVGPKDENLSALFTLKYQPENFHSDFREKGTIDTKITDNKLELEIKAVDKTLVSTEQEMVLTYRNITEETLSNLYLDIIYPADLDIVSVEPVKEGDYWIFDLEPQEEQTITIKGSFSADSKADQSLVGEIGNMVNDKFRRLARAEQKFFVVNPQFEVSLEINGKTENQSVGWGEVLRYQLDIINTSETNIIDAQVSALLDGVALDWGALDTIGQPEESRIVWTKETNEDLADWPAGESRTFTWQIKVVDSEQTERTIENIVRINIQGLESWEQVTTPILLTVGEGLEFNSGIYWDLGGRRVGSGLLPPRVGENTDYLVIWSLTEATGNFNTVTVETVLPPGVELLSETDVQEGDLEVDESTRTLSWTIEDFDDILLPVTASFIIRAIPSAEQQGSAMTLLNPMTITAEGVEEVILRSRMLKSSDVVSNSSGTIGIVE